ncbi:MAG: RNA-binding protein [Gammaproteobacteria bacterium]|nr:MAG: RNA-binding protein [Gammaproteobacteria bacterium]
MRHEIGIETTDFERIFSGEKTFEIRLNDQDFQAADTVLLKELRPSKTLADAMARLDNNCFTGRQLSAEIGYVTSCHQQEDYVVFSLVDVKPEW